MDRYSSGPGVSQGSGPNVFRDEEKKYQLHREQQMRRRNGRLVGGKLVDLPTDLSQLIDVAAGPAAVAPWLQAGRLREHEVQLDLGQLDMGIRTDPSSSTDHTNLHPSSSSSSTGCPPPPPPPPPTAKCYTLPAHPGFILIPNALSPQQQLRLIADSLELYPEPPSHTNHTLRYGPLPGLWRAAQQQDMNLAFKLGIDGPAAPTAHRTPHPSPPPAAPTTPSPCPASSPSPSAPSPSSTAVPPLWLPHGPGPSALQPPPPPPAPSPSSTAVPPLWLPHGPGPSALQLLHKLRWSSLGPPFNWTQRSYEGQQEHIPLPGLLRDIAVRVADAVQQLWVPFRGPVPTCAPAPDPECGPAPGHHTGATTTGPAQQLHSDQDSPDPSAPSTDITSANIPPPPSPPSPSSSPAPSAPGPSPRRPFLPDAALVNYYRLGDTLGGHLDDVERDLDQPIVGLSLGCEAVFLMGGRARGVQPTALRLRSGDVVVLAGEARMCYHGVPRILMDRGLPEELLSAGEGEELRPFVQHMRSARISISIRAVGG